MRYLYTIFIHRVKIHIHWVTYDMHRVYIAETREFDNKDSWIQLISSFSSALFPHWAEFIFNFNIFINNSRWQLLGVLCNIIITLSWEPLQIWWKTLQGKWPAFFGKSTAVFLWGDLAPWFWASNMYLPLALSGIKNTWHGRYIRYVNRVVYQSLHAQPGYYVITSSRCHDIFIPV